MIEKKYKIREDLSVYHNGRLLYRIESLKDFNDVKKGDLGGYIECENNLSHKGNCWLYDNAKAMDKSEVTVNAVVKNEAILVHNALVSGNCQVSGDSRIKGSASIFDNAKIEENATLYDNVTVYGNACISGYADIRHNVKIGENAKVFGSAQIWDESHVCGNAKVYGNANVLGASYIIGNAMVGGNAVIKGPATITGDAIVEKTSDYYVSKNTWSSYRYFTYTRSNKKWCVGCFCGTSEELIKKAYKDSKLSGDQYKLITQYVENMYALLEGKTSKTNPITHYLKRLFRK